MQVGSGSASITAANSNTITINPALTLNSDLAVTTTTATPASATTITLNGAVTGSANVTLSANNSGNNTSGVPYATITVANLNNSGTVTVDGNIGTGNTTLSKTFITSIGSNVTGLTKLGTGSLQVNGGTLSGTVTGASAQTITKGGNSAVLTVSGNNSSTFDGLWVATSSLATDFGSLKFSSSNAIGSSNAKIATSAGGIVVAGYAIDQAFVNRFTTATVNGQAASSSGVIALGADSSNPIDMRGTSGLLANTMYLGAVGTVTYSGTITPNGTTYQLGGSTGRLILNTANAFTGANSVTIGLTVASNSQQAGSIIQMAADQNYTGGTTIMSGTLSVSHLANGGSASGIGSSTNVATNLVLATVTGGPTGYLEYTGSGDTTNRLFSLMYSRGGGGILNNGTGGELNFTNTGSITTTNASQAQTAKTLYLGGSNTGNNTMAVKLVDVVGTSTGVVSLTKQDAGKWILTNANTYTGTTTVSGGTLAAGNANALGFGGLQTTATNGTTVSSGATLDLNGATSINEPITISGTGVGANGALVNNSGTAASIANGIAGLAVAATGSGSGYSSAPAVVITGTGSAAAATASLGLTTASITITNGGSGWAVGNTLNVTGGGGTSAIATVMTIGANGTISRLDITTAGTGYTTAPTTMAKITGSNSAVLPTFTGNALNFTVGGLVMTNAGSGYTGTPTITIGGSAATVTPTLSSVTLAADSSIGGTGNMTISAVVSESGGARALTKVGTGTATLSAENTYTGSTTVSTGTLQLDGSTASASTVAIGTAGTLSGNGTVNGNATLTGNGIINKSSGTIAGTLEVTGGNWNGNGTVTGAVTSSSGNFTIGSGATLTANGGMNVTGGTLLAGNSTSTITGSLNYTSSSNSTFSGVIAGSGKTLTMNATGATLTLSGNNTYTGATNVTAGTLLANNTSGSATGSGTVTVASGATLGGTGTISGATTIAGIVSPGDGGIGTLSITGNVTWQGAATAGSPTDWIFQLGESNTADLLHIAGDFTKDTSLGSNFRFDFGGSMNPGTFKLVDWTGSSSFSANSTVSDFTYTSLGSGLTGSFSLHDNQLDFIALPAVPEPSTWVAMAALALTGGAMAMRRRDNLKTELKPRISG